MIKLLQYPKLKRLGRDISLFKYLTFDSALLMIENMNLQFTRADKLNDVSDCHISMIDFSCIKTATTPIEQEVDSIIIAKLYERLKPQIDSFHVCSLGTTHDNTVLWERYAKNDGVCIEINYRKLIDYFIENQKSVLAFGVNYVSSTEQLIPFDLYNSEGGRHRKLFLYLLLTSKNKAEWEVEQEGRIILIDNSNMEFVRVNLSENCIKSIYLGKNCTPQQHDKILKALKKNNLTVEIIKCGFPLNIVT